MPIGNVSDPLDVPGKGEGVLGKGPLEGFKEGDSITSLYVWAVQETEDGTAASTGERETPIKGPQVTWELATELEGDDPKVEFRRGPADVFVLAVAKISGRPSAFWWSQNVWLGPRPKGPQQS